jgi:hypothetical protein
MAEQQRLRVSLHIKDLKSLDGLDVDNGCMPFRRREDGSIDMIASVSAAALKKLKAKRSVTVEVLGDTKEEAKRAAAEVSRTNRYADGSLPGPLGLEGVRHVD